MKSDNFERTLPEGYHEAYVIDATKGKFSLWLNVVAMALMIVIAVPLVAIIFITAEEVHVNSTFLLILCGLLIVYTILHELTHGIAYKLMTGEKLTFGVTLTVAFCGVPKIFVYRKTAMVALLAPFTVYSILFILLMIALPDPTMKLAVAILFAIHFGGCAGDLYDTFIYLTRFKDPKTLMQDTGPRQTFYVPK
ncbi:MAG: DUF3267 domain-containing protein [Oscillospiraceae bacterium]|nr:DUF3267 domain-containing protein [Oscillospiraceae bacterium]